MSLPVVLGVAFILIQALKIAYLRILRPRWILGRQNIPCARSGLYHFILGRFAAVVWEEPGAALVRWYKEYGPTYTLIGFAQTPMIVFFDKTALNYITSEDHMFQKPDNIRVLLDRVIGKGLVSTEGSTHARQRKIMNPAFGPLQIKAMYPVFHEKGIKLRNVMMGLLHDGAKVINMQDYCARITLDVICATGFGYECNSVELGERNELARAFSELYGSFGSASTLRVLTEWFPSLKLLVAHSKQTIASEQALKTMHRIGTKLLKEKKEAIHDHSEGKDLLTLLVKSNMSEDIKPKARMSDEEVLAQISTFLVAGSESTSASISWALYALSKDLRSQSILRAELTGTGFAGETPTFDELNSLQYLNAVARETLRIHAPVNSTLREAVHDCTIPLGEPFIDKKGVPHHYIQVPKGTDIIIPLLPLNTSETTWGPDAHVFRPERWLDSEKSNLPEGVLEIPSIHFPTFYAGGHACIGFRLALIEMKVLLYHLITTCEFVPAKGSEDIGHCTELATKPNVRSRPHEGPQLPLQVSLLAPSII